MNDLFGVEPKPLHGKHYVEPRGYAGIPGKGPEGERCNTCKHYGVRSRAKNYPKCGLMRPYWTGGRKTDILARSPACEKWDGDINRDD